MKRVNSFPLFLTVFSSPVLLFGQVDTTSTISYNQTMGLIFQIIFTVIGIFLSVVLTRLLARNGQVLKEIRDLGKRMDERTEKIAEKISTQIRESTEKLSELIVAESDKTRELIKALKG